MNTANIEESVNNSAISNGICRLCGRKDLNLIDVFSEEGLRNDLANKVEIYIPIKLLEHPIVCCTECQSAILSWHEFICKILKANRRSNLADEKVVCIRSVQNTSTRTEKIPDPPIHLDKTKNCSYENDGLEANGTSLQEIAGQEDNEIISLNPVKYEYTESDGPKYKGKEAKGAIRIRRKKNEVEYKYFCGICDRGFTRKFDMLRHKKQKHDEADTDCEYRNKNKEIIDKCKTNELFGDGNTMNEVEQGSNEIMNLIPVKLELSESEDLCSPEYEENSEPKRPIRIRRKKSEVENRYFCETCDKGFTRKYDMLRHKKQKHDEKALDSDYRNKNKEIINKCRINVDGRTMYECDFCKRKTTHSYNLMRHRSIHTGVKPHVCYICGKSFRLDSTIRQHIKQFHEGVKNYRCEICNKNFGTKLARDEHLNTHSGERPYSCDICQKSFRQKSSLYIHKLYHDKNFRFECSLCEKKFRRAQELLIHERIHTGHRPYSCNVCSAKFIRSNDLKRHKRIHTKNELEWICSICKSRFKQERYLMLHMKVHMMQES